MLVVTAPARGHSTYLLPLPAATPQQPPFSSAHALIIIKALKAASLRGGRLRPHIGATHLDLSDEEAAALTQELHDTVANDRYPFSPRIRTLREILNKLRPEPVREALPPPKHYEPPRATAGRRRR